MGTFKNSSNCRGVCPSSASSGAATGRVANVIDEAIKLLWVAVVIECSHFCMVMRGVQKVGAKRAD